ncbi:hypothetical protein OIE66_09730 [Nonomuraea sp. NBC_01738]|uniref:hypothetical protein n=1 Tax=Nonomuraea sp. NBC_01738 TaxID=2976003 RepID=UPI002E1397AB|nr:hypothetical protein OIE66_09730 [Nonomuraea sp. NBC_01738]
MSGSELLRLGCAVCGQDDGLWLHRALLLVECDACGARARVVPDGGGNESLLRSLYVWGA